MKMKSNKLTPHHVSQLAILIILFVIVIVAAAWVYKKQIYTIIEQNRKPVTKQEIEKVYGEKINLSDESKIKIESIYGN
jgi:hypothetical protein